MNTHVNAAIEKTLEMRSIDQSGRKESRFLILIGYNAMIHSRCQIQKTRYLCRIRIFGESLHVGSNVNVTDKHYNSRHIV